MTPTILEQRILDLARREPGARAARVNVGAEYSSVSQHTCAIPGSVRAQLVYKLRARGLLKPHDPERPGLWLP